VIAMSTHTSTGRTRTATGTTDIQKASFVVGAVFLIVGIAGFVPGITTNYDDLTWAGPESDAMLLDVFEVSILHNAVHLAFGVLGLIASRTIDASKLYLLGGGLIYAVLFLYGLVVDRGSDANFVPVNAADDWLHLGLAVGMIGLAALLWPRTEGRLTETREY
jgi:hypothetical protein